MASSTLSILSQSSLQDYAECPQRFKLRHIDRLSYPALESEPALENEKSQLEGQYFHRLAQQALLGMDVVKLTRLAGSPDLVGWWQNFLDHRPVLDDYTIYTEFSLAAPLGSLRLVAKYDVIAVSGGRATIVDWKTYRRRPSDAQLAAGWQSRVYPALLAHAGRQLNHGQDILPENIQMLYWFAEFPMQAAVFSYSTAQFERDWQALAYLAEELPSAVEFAQTDDVRLCGYCVYRSYCERGIRAAEGSPSEVELLPSSLFELDFEQIAEIAF